MNQLESRTFLADRLMIGPDGVVYALRSGTLRALPPDDLSSAVAPSRSRHSGEGRQGAAYSCYSSGEPPICFKYSAEPHRDLGNPPICFKYSAEPRRDGGEPGICFAY
jgi:hypothetical protein